MAGIAIVAILVVALDVLLYATLRSTLTHNIDSRLDSYAPLVRAEAGRGAVDDLPARLARVGVDATVRNADGAVVAQAVGGTSGGGQVARRVVALGGGDTVEITGSLAQADRTLGRLLRLELILSPLVVALAFLLLRLIAEIAMRPLEEIAKAAHRTAEGQLGERLRPYPVDTRLGRMAVAYDDMLDALELALTDAGLAKARSDEMQERYRETLHTARDAFVAIDAEGVIIDWNDAAERDFGWTRSEAVGLRVADTIIPEDLRLDHLKGLSNLGLAGLADRLTRVGDLEAQRRDGSRFPVEVTAWLTEHGQNAALNAFIRDVTQRAKAEAVISRLASIVESSDEAMLSTTLGGVILTWNRGAEHMYGYRAQEVVGRSLDVIMPTKEDLATRAAGGSKVARSKRSEETLRRRRDGSLIDVASIVSPVLDAGGAVCGACSVERDITEERRLAAELDATLAALEAALTEAQASELSTRQFFDDAAHQLRSPITSIRACAETLLRGAGDPGDQNRLLGAVVRETSRAGRLMTGLLQMARLNEGRELTKLPCDLVDLCREEADRIFYIAPHLVVTIVAADPQASSGLEIDRSAVAEILANLLDNCARHAVGRIWITVVRSGDLVELRITDDGPGLPPDMVEAVFDRFVSIDGKGGSGLGLPIARTLARAHGGELSYESKAFVVRIPAHAAAGGDRRLDLSGLNEA